MLIKASVIKAVLLLTVCSTGTSETLAQAGRARLSGRLSDGQGKPIPSAVVVVCNADADFWFITSTDTEGKFGAPGLPANQFAIEVLSPQWRRPTGMPGRDQVWGYSPWSDTIRLQPAQDLEKNIQLGQIVLQPRESQTTPPCTPRRSFSILGAGALDRLFIDGMPPVYPPSAKAANLQGDVHLELFMNRSGRVISIRLLASSWPPKIDSILTKAAVEAVRDWRYQPRVSSQINLFEFGGQVILKFPPPQ